MIRTEKPKKWTSALWFRIVRATAILVLFIVFLGIFMAQPGCFSLSPSGQTVAPDRLYAHVAMLSETLVPRDYQHVQNLDRCAEYIAMHLRQAGASVELQVYEVQGQTYKNVIASFGPRSDSRIVVGAHYDAYLSTPGADDNASGVAGLIELGYLLGTVPLAQQVELVAFTLEEPPFFRSENMGSAQYADALRSDDVGVEAMICLEMIGFFSDEENSQDFPTELFKLYFPDRGNYIAVIGSVGDRALITQVKGAMAGATDLPVYSMNAPKSFPGLDFSDHLNFWNQGYTAVMITDTAFYRNHAYHTPDDTLHRLDYDRMAKVVLGVYEAVIHLANNNEG